MALGIMSGLTQGVGAAVGGPNVQTGEADSGHNIINVGSPFNLSDMLLAMNQGSTANGGNPYSTMTSPIGNLNNQKPVSVQVSALGNKLDVSVTPFLLIGGGVLAVWFLMRRKR